MHSVRFILLVFSISSIIFGACKNDTQKANPSPKVISTAVPVPVITEDVKMALSKLSDVTPSEGTLVHQLFEFAQSGQYDLGTEFKFLDLQWKSNTAEWKANSDKEIVDLARFMTEFPKMIIKIEAYTDNEGDDQKNLKLTEARVHAIKSKLKDAGIADERVIVEGMGEKYPVGDNKIIEGRMINNRVVVTLRRFNQ